MSYPATTQTLQKWLQEIDEKALLLKNAAMQQRQFAQAGQLNMDMMRRFFDLLVQMNGFFGDAAAVNGLASYTAAEKRNQVADPIAEFAAMRNAVISTLDWLRANVPSGTFRGTAYRQAFFFPADNLTPSSALTFTAAETSGYRTVLDALGATIG